MTQILQEESCKMNLSADGLHCILSLPELNEGYLYTLDLPGVVSQDGNPLLGDKVYYTLHRKK